MLGYPPILIVAVLAVGLPLATFRPYSAFLCATFLLASLNAGMLNATRTEALGPYLNLGDACLLVALAAFLFDSVYRRLSFQIPRVVFLLLAVLFVAALQSVWLLGWTYETIRAFRWGLQFPLAFFLGANLVTTPSRTKKLLGVLLAGAIVATLQHLFYVSTLWRSMALSMETYHLVRTIAYMGGGMSAAFLLTGAVWKMPVNVGQKTLWLIVGSLFVTSAVSSQTRSVWIATVAAVPLLLILFQPRSQMMSILRLGVLVLFLVLAVGWVSRVVAPGFDISEVVTQRMSTLFDEDPREAQTLTRINQFRVEMDSWLRGTLILGRGLFFFQTIDEGEGRDSIAFAHLGYVTYLSQLGLLGLLIYGVYLPLNVVRDARQLWHHRGLPVLQYVGLLGATSVVFLSIMFLMSSSFLQLGYYAPGVLYGAVWALARRKKRQLKTTKFSRLKKAPDLADQKPAMASLAEATRIQSNE